MTNKRKIRFVPITGIVTLRCGGVTVIRGIHIRGNSDDMTVIITARICKKILVLRIGREREKRKINIHFVSAK